MGEKPTALKGQAREYLMDTSNADEKNTEALM